MAKKFSKNFYKSKMWQDCREAYAKKKCYICERCGAPGTEVHHKIILTPENINDPSVTTNWDNLCLLCWDCHRKLHREQSQKENQVRRYVIDEDGQVIIPD